MLTDPGARWPWAIIDEAYQMRSDSLLRIARLFDKALFVGDPGQLDPFSTVETERWLGLNWDPIPFSRPMEDFCLPDADKLVAAAKKTLNRS